MDFSQIPSWAINHNLINVVSPWDNFDDEERYRANFSKKKARMILKYNQHSKKSVVYKHNEFGFRSPSFNDDIKDNNIVVIGCSYTYGTGLNIEDTWGYKLGQKIGLPTINLGLGGQSAYYCYKLLKVWIPILKPKYVFCLIPHAFRLGVIAEIYNNGIYHLEPIHMIHLPPDHLKSNTYFKNLIKYEDINFHEIRSDDIDKFKYLELLYGIPLYIDGINKFGGIEMEGHKDPKGIDMARDCSHPGRLFHKALAEQMYRKIK
jgi:hypothetical protein